MKKDEQKKIVDKFAALQNEIDDIQGDVKIINDRLKKFVGEIEDTITEIENEEPEEDNL